VLDMTPERRRPTRFDGGHDTTLAETQMSSMGLAVSGTVVAEHIRHLQRVAHEARSARGRHLEA
jgi:hypothetical protein